MNSKFTSIIVTGSLGFDYIMDFPGLFSERIMPEAIHKISLSFLVETLKKQFGGTAGNIAYTLTLLGEKPTIMAPAGNDFSPYLTFLKKQHMDVSGIVIHKDVPTSSYFVITDKEDNQIGSFFIGAMKYAPEISLSGISKKALVIISPTDPKAMVKYVDTCIRLGVPYIYDPAFQIATFSPIDLKHGIRHAAILVGNDYEISLIEKQLHISHATLLSLVPIVITTLGSKGSLIEHEKEKIVISPAQAHTVIDPTGAGDAYRSGFLAGYMHGCDLKTCGQMGSIAAVYTVEQYGTSTHTFTKKEFITRYKKNYGSTISL